MQHTSAQPGASVDLDSFLNRCMGRQELVNRMLTSFRVGVQNDRSQLQEAVSSGNPQRVAQIAHKVKGAAATVAANPLSQIAAQLDDIARYGDLQQIRDCAREVFEELDRVERFIAEFVQGGDRSLSSTEKA